MDTTVYEVTVGLVVGGGTVKPKVMAVTDDLEQAITKYDEYLPLLRPDTVVLPGTIHWVRIYKIERTLQMGTFKAKPATVR